ncbi:hypothetical protein EPI10_004658 [Gossypium australe]|uniref:Uncharacterized protein n=1 Tax=Gossypium australe TaxID=47621 RepID=A0A5B6WNE3_9ROSI|nr:hypothetical protein EPI10_004658 [Gossypium australe]
MFTVTSLTPAGKSSSTTFPVPREIVVPNDGIYIYSRSNTNFSHKSASSSGQHPMCQFCNNSLGSCTAKVSDQNLADEDQGKKNSNVRCKKLEDDGSSRCFEPRSMGTIDNSIFNKTYAKGEKKKLVWKGSCPESSVYSYMLPGIAVHNRNCLK